MGPRKIMIIRHAEKSPKAGPPPQGVDIDGPSEQERSHPARVAAGGSARHGLRCPRREGPTSADRETGHRLRGRRARRLEQPTPAIDRHADCFGTRPDQRPYRARCSGIRGRRRRNNPRIASRRLPRRLGAQAYQGPRRQHDGRRRAFTALGRHSFRCDPGSDPGRRRLEISIRCPRCCWPAT